jgi:hypothetical protein
MSTITSALPSEKGISIFIRNHPIVAYFVLAFAGTWLVISPLVMDAFGLIELSDAAWMLFYLLDSLTGPNLAAFWVTGVIEGKAGMGRLFRRMFQFRAGLQPIASSITVHHLPILSRTYLCYFPYFFPM